MQFVIVVFPDHTHLIFIRLNINVRGEKYKKPIEHIIFKQGRLVSETTLDKSTL